MQHWLSFSSHVHGFLGVVIVEAPDEEAAVAKAMQIAPEAAAKACTITGGPVDDYEPHWLDRLITKPEIDTIGEPCTPARKPGRSLMFSGACGGRREVVQSDLALRR
jgi:hypothetical protein